MGKQAFTKSFTNSRASFPDRFINFIQSSGKNLYQLQSAGFNEY